MWCSWCFKCKFVLDQTVEASCGLCTCIILHVDVIISWTIFIFKGTHTHSALRPVSQLILAFTWRQEPARMKKKPTAVFSPKKNRHTHKLCIIHCREIDKSFYRCLFLRHSLAVNMLSRETFEFCENSVVPLIGLCVNRNCCWICRGSSIHSTTVYRYYQYPRSECKVVYALSPHRPNTHRLLTIDLEHLNAYSFDRGVNHK